MPTRTSATPATTTDTWPKPPDAGERDLNPLEPLDVSVVEDEIQEQHQQERPAECRDLRVGRDDQLFVAGRAVRKFQRAVAAAD